MVFTCGPIHAMKGLLAAVVVTLWIGTSPILAQGESNGLKVQPDKDSVLANSLVGAWVPDVELNKRLGKRGEQHRLEFVADAKVLAGVPAAIAKKLLTYRIYLAGTMTMRDQKHAFLVTNHTGNPTIIWFRERAGDPMGDAESWNASLVRAQVAQADLLFLGGDNNNQAFAAYKRDSKVVGKLTPSAAIAEMTRMLVAGEARKFVTTYCAPDDLSRMQKAGRGLDRLEQRFAGPRGKQFLEALAIANKSEPVMSGDGDLATWTLDLEGFPPRLSLQRIDGRWYLRNR